MKKKSLIIICSVLIVIILSCFVYVSVGSQKAEKLMIQYLENKGYTIQKDIYDIDVRHSFLNIILSYNEWGINVKYNDEKEAIYIYTIKNGKIVEAGVSGTVEKEDLKHKD